MSGCNYGDDDVKNVKITDEPRSNYITPEGARLLRDELGYLLKVERPRVTQAVSDAAAEGDRSENAEYIYGKKRLREIDRRIRFLAKRLDVLNVVEDQPGRQGKVFFGAWQSVAGRSRMPPIAPVVPDLSEAETDCLRYRRPAPCSPRQLLTAESGFIVPRFGELAS